MDVKEYYILVVKPANEDDDCHGTKYSTVMSAARASSLCI